MEEAVSSMQEAEGNRKYCMQSRPAARSFTDLIAWQEGHKLVLQVYAETKNFPKEEVFGLVNQLRRAVVSITSNIAEGFNRRTEKDKLHFYTMAIGSVGEVQNQLLIARDVKYITGEKFSKHAEQSILVHKLLTGLIRSIKG